VAAQMLKSERRNIKKATTYFGNLAKIITFVFLTVTNFYRTEDKARTKT
jgi:hypothetical protein